jgi:NADH:ubiquinone oxidoreductase subunit K
MIYFNFFIAFFLFLFGLIGFLFSRKESLIFLIIALEIMLLAIGFLFVNISFLLDDAVGITLTLYLLPLAGAESAIALAIFIAYYPMRGTLSIN